MKFGLYPRLALAGIRKNKRLYIPYLLTCTGMAMMYYIIIFLQHNEMLDGMRGGTTASTILALGGWVVAIFACIFLFYTHSFLLRRRKKEFGLYNILGMGRRHLVRIEIWETIFVAIGTTAAGLLCGIAFSKLAELGLMNLMHGSISYVFSISAPAIMATLLIFGVIHLLLLLRAAVAVGRSSAIQLLQSEAAGEKPPRANWVLGLLAGLYPAGSGLLHGSHHQGAADGAGTVLCGGDTGHSGHLSHYDKRQRAAVPPAAEEHRLLL